MAMADSVFSWRETAKDVAASFMGAASCCFVGQPFDTIKVRMQSRPTEFTGMVQGTLKTVRAEGVLALWKGWPATLTGMMMENAAAFGVNEQLKRSIPEPVAGDGSSTLWQYSYPLAMGALTGSVTGVVLCPADNVKVKAQYAVVKAGETAPSTSEMLALILKRQGALKGLFNGLDAQLMRDGPFYMVFFGSYELNRAALLPHMPDTAATFVAGGLAGMIGWTAVMPFDGPKSVVQASWDSRVVGDFPKAARSVFASRGVNGLFAGMWPAMLRAFPANAALFVGYEATRDAIKKW